MNTHIKSQVKLPFAVALEVVLQGIRIRLGRSVVTILGVALGIAFLMSILTTQLIRAGVSEESKLRSETRRMMSFLASECGPLGQRVVALVQVGPLSAHEIRLVEALAAEHPAALRWSAVASASAPGTPADKDLAVLPGLVERTSLDQLARDATAVVVLGAGQVPATLDFNALLTDARQRVVGCTRTNQLAGTIPGTTVVQLARQAPAEEVAAAAVAARREQARNLWIIVISLMVTVIGISNSMLMSVTERFREIGTMKCLGALSAFIRRLFLIESTLVGSIGAVAGALFGAVFPILLYGPSFGFGMVFTSLSYGRLAVYALFSIIVGVVLSTMAAVYPARMASKMVPAAALRSNV